MAQTVKRLPGMQETQAQFLGWEDPLEKEMAIHSSTLAWKIPWMEEPDRLQSMGSQRVGHNFAMHALFKKKEENPNSMEVGSECSPPPSLSLFLKIIPFESLMYVLMTVLYSLFPQNRFHVGEKQADVGLNVTILGKSLE